MFPCLSRIPSPCQLIFIFLCEAATFPLCSALWENSECWIYAVVAYALCWLISCGYLDNNSPIRLKIPD